MADQPVLPDRVPLASPDVASERAESLKSLFPEAFSEGKIDLARFAASLGDIAEPQREHYGLSWAGKLNAIRAIQSRSIGTLKPDRQRSVNFDATGNLFIEGDNLEVLKLVQRSYRGRVKMIYIDPPYNTGREFIYPDNYAEGLRDYLKFSKQVDEGGGRLGSNADTNGRYHSKWLSMMYPRLFLAHSMLDKDGVILVSIDDHELHNLRHLLDEIFGEENYLATFAWVNEGNIDNQSRIKSNYESVVLYARDETRIIAPPVIDPNVPKDSKLYRDFIDNTIVKNGPGNPVTPVEIPVGFPAGFEEGRIDPKQDFWPQLDRPIEVKGSRVTAPFIASSGWSSREILDEFIRSRFKAVKDTKGQDCTFYVSNTGAICVRKTRLESQSHVLTVLRGMGTVQNASAALHELGIEFAYPKPIELIGYFIEMFGGDDGIVLDFFAGSGTTGHALWTVNRKLGRRNRFILVQLPEPLTTPQTIGDVLSGTISDLAAHRLRLASAKLLSDQQLGARSVEDVGLKVLKLDASNFKVWDAEEAGELARRSTQSIMEYMKAHVQNVLPDAKDEDLLFELMLKSGIDLCADREAVNIDGKRVYRVDSGALAICLDEGISAHTIRAIIALAPKRVICLDRCFNRDDALKTNTVLEMKSHEIQFQTA